jgi:hypothetical protein
MSRRNLLRLVRLLRRDGPAMAAEPTDKPEQRAAGAVVVFDASQSPTVRARRQGRWMQRQTLGSLVRRFCFVGFPNRPLEPKAQRVLWALPETRAPFQSSPSHSPSGTRPRTRWSSSLRL